MMESNQRQNYTSLIPIVPTIKTDWKIEVTLLLEDLWYPSESDEPIEWFCFSTSMLPPLTVAEFAVAQHISSEVLIEEKEVENFWAPITVIEDWFGEEEQRQVENFLALKSLLETNFGYWQVFRVGEVEIDLYLLTKINAEEWGGLKTRIIETE